MASILVIEDNLQFQKFIGTVLYGEGFRVACVNNGADAFAFLAQQKPDLIVLDLRLPGMDGLEVCRRIRADAATHAIPVIMCTEKSTDTDMIVGLEVGADDYIPKPIVPTVLVARIKAALRRNVLATQPQERVSPPLSAGAIRLDPSSRSCTVKAREVGLTPKEYDLLAYYMQHPGVTLKRTTVIGQVWGYRDINAYHSIDTIVYTLRKKLGTEGDRIQTIPSIGYFFKGA